MWQDSRIVVASHYEKVNLHVLEFFPLKYFLVFFFNVAKVIRKLRLLDLLLFQVVKTLGLNAFSLAMLQCNFLIYEHLTEKHEIN